MSVMLITGPLLQIGCSNDILKYAKSSVQDAPIECLSLPSPLTKHAINNAISSYAPSSIDLIVLDDFRVLQECVDVFISIAPLLSTGGLIAIRGVRPLYSYEAEPLEAEDRPSSWRGEIWKVIYINFRGERDGGVCVEVYRFHFFISLLTDLICFFFFPSLKFLCLGMYSC
jgi:hypothetical protein